MRKRKLSLNELKEIRREAYDNTRLSKERAKFFHDKLIHRKQFSPGQKVLLYDSYLHLFPGKLRSRSVNLYEVVRVLSHRAVEIRDSTKDQVFKMNGHKLKPMLELPTEEEVERISLYESPRSNYLCEKFLKQMCIAYISVSFKKEKKKEKSAKSSKKE